MPSRNVLAVLGLAVLAACASDKISTPAASAQVVTSKTSLVVGDTMLVKAGLRFGDGRFTEFTSYTVTVADTNIARVLAGTRIVQAKEPGFAVIRVRIPGNASFAVDSTYRVDAAP
jgi:type IV pilus biogenesis protein CpaD/CtpE